MDGLPPVPLGYACLGSIDDHTSNGLVSTAHGLGHDDTCVVGWLLNGTPIVHAGTLRVGDSDAGAVVQNDPVPF